VSLTDSRRCT